MGNKERHEKAHKCEKLELIKTIQHSIKKNEKRFECKICGRQFHILPNKERHEKAHKIEQSQSNRIIKISFTKSNNEKADKKKTQEEKKMEKNLEDSLLLIKYGIKPFSINLIKLNYLKIIKSGYKIGSDFIDSSSVQNSTEKTIS